MPGGRPCLTAVAQMGFSSGERSGLEHEMKGLLACEQ